MTSRPDRSVLVNLTRQAVKDAPPYDPAIRLYSNLEIGLHKHYDRAWYWADQVKLENLQYRLVKSSPSEATQKKL